jgi:hypothetical protein
LLFCLSLAIARLSGMLAGFSLSSLCLSFYEWHLSFRFISVVTASGGWRVCSLGVGIVGRWGGK